MRALIVHEPNRFSVEDVERPRPGRYELLCRVKAIAICGTDPHIIQGDFGFWPKAFPFIPGHEWTGEVVELGEGAADLGWETGQRVAGTSHAGCGFCRLCVEGRYNLCENFGDERLHRQYGHYTQGAYADYVVHSVKSVFAVPDELSDEEAAMLDPTSIALHTVKRGAHSPGDTVAVIGAGAMGLLVAECARALGAGRVLVVGRGARLEKAASLGHETIDFTEEDTVVAIRERSGAAAPTSCSSARATPSPSARASRRCARAAGGGDRHSAGRGQRPAAAARARRGRGGRRARGRGGDARGDRARGGREDRAARARDAPLLARGLRGGVPRLHRARGRRAQGDRPPVRGWALLAALFLGALALRPQLVGVGPLIPEIDEDLGVSHTVAGLLTTIPVLCMGLFAIPGAYVAARLGTRAAIGACLAGIAVFGLLRAAAPGAPLVLALTFPIGVGMGLAGALMPVAVKERFAHRPAFASGVYTTGINLGSALSSALAVPIAAAWGGWRAALAVFSACTILCFAAWLFFTPSVRGERVQTDAPPLPWDRRVVWGLAIVFALQSIVYYGLVAWMPDSFQERGWSDAAAGALLGVMSVAALPAGLVVPYLADRGGSRRQWLTLTAGMLLVATVGIAACRAAGGYGRPWRGSASGPRSPCR